MGFITQENLEFLGIKDHVAVYVPQSYNFAGNLLVFHKSQIQPINKPGGDIMTFIVSAGISIKKES